MENALIGAAITIVVALVSAVYGYGRLSQRVTTLETERKACTKRFETIEGLHASQYSQMAETVRQIEKSLDMLIGKIDMFFRMFAKKE